MQPDVKSGMSPSTEHPWPSPKQAWYAIGVFAVVLMLNFLDRGIVGLLVPQLKQDLGLSDTQVGLIMGFAFACFYIVVGYPIARLADSRSRRAIIGVGLATWSFMTALCGLAQNFWQLFLFRMGVGVGEACNGPATFSMIADYFPPAKLPRAAAVLNLGFTTGTGLSLLIGGAIIHALANKPEVTLPILGTLHSWQITFMVVGVPGLVVALLLRTVVEPIRRGRMSGGLAGGGQAVNNLPLPEVWKFIRANGGTYGPMFLGLALQTVLSLGIGGWTPTFWPLGLIPGGMLAERLARKGYDDAYLRVTVISLAVVVPLTILFPLMPTPRLALGVLALQGFAASFSIGPWNAALQVITPGEMRGQITALFLFMFNIVGVGLGPSVVPLFTDYVFHDEQMLKYSLVCTAAILGPLAVLTMAWGLKSYGRSVARARAWQ